MTNTDVLTGAAPELKADKAPHKPVELPPELARNRLLDSAKAAALLNYSVPHFRRLYRTGVIPAPVMINTRKKGWVTGTLLDLIAARAGERS